jgi:hypothetical protein
LNDFKDSSVIYGNCMESALNDEMASKTYYYRCRTHCASRVAFGMVISCGSTLCVIEEVACRRFVA